MKKYRMLILTNHKTHTENNSFYGFVNSLVKNKSCENIDITSVTSKNNLSFYEGNTKNVFVVRVEGELSLKDISKFELTQKVTKITDYDVIILRVPHPVSTNFLNFLSKSVGEERIINSPRGILECGNKSFLLEIPHLCAPLWRCKNELELKNLLQKHPLILKPLEGFGGKGIVKIDGDKVFLSDSVQLLDSFLKENNVNGYLAVEYLRNVSKGDKRIGVINGKIIFATNRVPKKGKFLCNVGQGGEDNLINVTNRERKMVQEVSKKLLEKGIIIFGLDTLIDNSGKRVVSEINVMSVGGFFPHEMLSGKPTLRKASEELWRYINKNIVSINKG